MDYDKLIEELYDGAHPQNKNWKAATAIETLCADLARVTKERDAAKSADVAPVVRCEECRYYQNAKLNKKGFLICPASGMEITEDDYCSYGERKEDDT